MKLASIISLTILFLVTPQISFAGGPEVKELLKTTTTWNGGSFTYPQGKAEVTIVNIKLAEGMSAPMHCHPVPTAGYVLEGKIEVTLNSGESQIFKKGDAVMEVSHTIHNGKAIDGPVELLVFYAGAVGTPHTELPDSNNCIKGIRK
ncbi:MAG: cupin domain-containing protein [Nitrospinales bacterium]